MMNYDMLEEGGQNNPAFQMDRQQSGPSHQPQPGPPPSQPSPAPRPVSIPSRGVPVLPRVCSRPPSSYGEETGYISDSASRPSYMGSRASHTSHNTDRSSYPPSSSRPKGLYRIDP
ncbi:hypothetical protein E2C01_053554 [Portunus trituberculatus]|uniref:Uncharacterized protein n=2 Tax=Portunus trituberculatus TaxID=210409 RepID=A0A5B7GHF3_PORTR|nr:hypothetical protein [Portunus trituberculatus]